MSERRRLPGSRFFDRAYGRADRALDTGQRDAFRLLWFFLPETSIARDPRFQQVIASRFLSDAAQQGLAYGALIAVVRGGGSAFDAALVGVAAVLPAALLGFYGGAVADALPRRVALAAIYNLQALLCILIPSVIGTDFVPILFLIFAINTLGQVSGPTELAVLPLVASTEQLASAASLVNLFSAAGTAFGTALLAPILVRVFGVDTVFYVSGVLLFLAASRVFDLSTVQHRRKIDWRRPHVNVRGMIAWLVEQPAVGTMIIVGVLSGTANIVLQTLAPRYVQSVLHVDPAEAVYVFAPSAVGLVLALLLAPILIKRSGERLAALLGFSITAVTLVLLGVVGNVGAAIDAVNPLHVVNALGFDIGERLRTAALLAFPLGFSVSLTTTSVQTYINRRVPHSFQGRAFALQGVIKNGASALSLLTLGAAATSFGVDRVLLAAPFALLIAAYGLISLSTVFAGIKRPRSLDVLASFWEESEGAVGTPGEAKA